jgi:hypothetical protein
VCIYIYIYIYFFFFFPFLVSYFRMRVKECLLGSSVDNYYMSFVKGCLLGVEMFHNLSLFNYISLP